MRHEPHRSRAAEREERNATRSMRLSPPPGQVRPLSRGPYLVLADDHQLRLDHVLGPRIQVTHFYASMPSLIPLKKPDLRRCSNFPVTAAYTVGANGDSPSSFLENFAPCVSGFLSGIRFRGFCRAIIIHFASNALRSLSIRNRW